MDIKVLKEMDNEFFKRRDLEVEIPHQGLPTPKTIELKAELAKKYKVDESQILVDYILTTRGIGKSRAKVKILREKPPVVEEEKKENPPEQEKKTETKEEKTEGAKLKESDKNETQASEKK